jgi:DNA-binding response OmpR family regulator
MTRKKKILIVEDEKQIRESLQDFFNLQGYDVIAAPDGDEGLAKALSETPDLVVLDIMLPGMHGYDVCRRLRAEGFKSPVLFLTAKGEEVDKLTGFDVGGDDYVTKPFSLLELQARARALLRRAEKEEPEEDRYSFEGVSVNFMTYDLRVAGKPVKLSAKEMELLRFLIRHRGQVLSREVLLDKVWNYDSQVSTRTVDTHILNLRRKLNDAPPNRFIQTVHGVGYKFVGGL